MSYIDYDAESHYKSYFINRIPSVKEQDILFLGQSLKGYIFERVYFKKFNYKESRERILIIHALSQIPLSLAECSSFKDFESSDIKVLSDNTLSIMKSFHNNAINSLEPELPYYTHGHYSITYNNKYTFNILYSEGLGIKDDACVNIHAVRFDTEKELFDFIKKARSFGLDNFLLEKEEKENKKYINVINREKIKKDILLSMP